MTELRVGTLLLGYCGGHFGRDSYNDKRVEAIGVDWVVVRNEDDGDPEFYSGTPEDLLEYVEGRDCDTGIRCCHAPECNEPGVAAVCPRPGEPCADCEHWKLTRGIGRV